MKQKKDILDFGSLDNVSKKGMMCIVMKFSIPAILAQITSVIMQYIDAAMVGSLGANASASIGLVSTTTWLLNGICTSAVTGFSVQIAQLVGAKRNEDVRNVFRQAIVVLMTLGLFMGTLALCISPFLPIWLGGDSAIRADSTKYFTVFAFILPATQLRQLCAGSLQCSGDMKTPSMLSIVMCFMNVIFNFFFIFPTREISAFGLNFFVYGANLGVTGAAIGTLCAEYLTAFLMLWRAGFKSDKLKFSLGGSWKIRKT